ncbi:MAG: EutP/PduV family microcompartment system protein [Anaerovoracaceae bacterium]|jgi:ethanolamine utilization protein EutP
MMAGRKRVMVIGPTGSGKTTLINALNHVEDPDPVRKTQNIIYKDKTIDVPGAYLECPWMYKHIIAAAQGASHVLIVVDQSRCDDIYSPGFAKVFRCPVLGVITKTDLKKENEEVANRLLNKAGVEEPYFRVSTLTDEGVQELRDYLFEASD